MTTDFPAEVISTTENHAEAGDEIFISGSTSSIFGAQVPTAHLATAASPHVP
jgi:hypothetical protein